MVKLPINLWRSAGPGRILANLRTPTQDSPHVSEIKLNNPLLPFRSPYTACIDEEAQEISARPFSGQSSPPSWAALLSRPGTIIFIIGCAFNFLFLSFLLNTFDHRPTWASSSSPEIINIYQTASPFNKSGENCSVPYQYVSDISKADVVVWANPAVGLSRYKPEEAHEQRPWQIHAFWSLENALYYPQLKWARKNLRLHNNQSFDLEMTYRTTSDVPLSYAYGFIDMMRKPLSFQEKRQDKIAAAFVSNCSPRNNRTNILGELLKLLPDQIDSFGSCHQNAEIDDVIEELGLAKEGEKLSRWNQKMGVIEKYKFTIAFENADEEDYVTEKYYQPLSAGSVPIHLGQTPEQFQKFKPSPDSVINVKEFESVSALAERLKEISNDESRYQNMLSWKDKPLSGRFADLVNWGKDGEWCRLAKFVKKKWHNPLATRQEGYEELYSMIEYKPKRFFRKSRT